MDRVRGGMGRVRAVVILLIAGVLGLGLVPSAAAAVPVRYVALGDSYSSGLGASTNYAGGRCDRSAGAFSALWSSSHAPASYLSLACSKADTAAVGASQLPSLPSDTTLISVTVGGNDVGFGAIMTTCALRGTTACVSAVGHAETAANTTLPGRLELTYRAISARAPRAKVVVLSYPLFYQLGTWFCVGLSETSRGKIDQAIDLVDARIAAAARRAGFSFADVRSAFVGHQLCSGQKWLHAINLTDLTESYHPTAAGQRNAYLPVFTAAAG